MSTPIAIHAVWAVYRTATMDASVQSSSSEPQYYACRACPFTGTLEEGIGHAVSNQFKVAPPKPVQS